MLFKGRGKVGDGRISQHDGNLGYTQSFFIEQVSGMLHPLALVKVEDGGAEHFLKPFFEVAFVDGYLAAELLDGERFSDMFQENLARMPDLFAVRFVGQELAAEGLHFLFSQHTVEAVKEQHLCLGIEENIFETIRIGMIQQRFDDVPDAAAEGKDF